MTTRTDEIAAALIAHVREAVAPVRHLTDAQIGALFEPPMARLLIDLRRVLREANHA